MNEQDAGAVILTNAQLVGAPAEQRVGLVETFLLASIGALSADAPKPTAGSRLADLAIDSLQLVELKFELDQVLGHEVDIELIISNPTVSELALSSVRDAGL